MVTHGLHRASPVFGLASSRPLFIGIQRNPYNRSRELRAVSSRQPPETPFPTNAGQLSDCRQQASHYQGSIYYSEGESPRDIFAVFWYVEFLFPDIVYLAFCTPCIEAAQCIEAKTNGSVGCWGIVRHPNYVGDIVFSFCTCVCCGWSHVLPYMYFIYMTILLIHRCYRDEKRCLAKYGSKWEEYQRVVRWRMIPGLF